MNIHFFYVEIKKFEFGTQAHFQLLNVAIIFKTSRLTFLWNDTTSLKLSAARALDTPRESPIVLTGEVQMKSRTTTYELEWLRERVVLFLGNDTNISHVGLRKKKR